MHFRFPDSIYSSSVSCSFIRLTSRRVMDAIRSSFLLLSFAFLYFASDAHDFPCVNLSEVKAFFVQSVKQSKEPPFCPQVYTGKAIESSCRKHENGLKCRAAAEVQQSNDFEYVVRMCLRHLRNESDIYDLYRMQNDYDSGRNKRYREDNSNSNNNNNNNNNNDNRNYYNRNRGYPEGFDRWSPNSAPHNDRNRYDDDRNRQDGEYEETDYYGMNRGGKDGRKKYKQRPPIPHSYQQQLQHDRDVYNRGNREQGNYFHSNRNKNKYNRDKNSDSPLADIDPCVIHCIFQEMQMVDDNGKPNKGLISQKMTQRIRNSELKSFIQESVDECFDAIDDDEYNSYGGNRQRKPEMMCEWAKTFAMCMEDRGRENCDDWNEPIQKNNNYSGNNNSNNKNNEDQRHKSKQNDRG